MKDFVQRVTSSVFIVLWTEQRPKQRKNQQRRERRPRSYYPTNDDHPITTAAKNTTTKWSTIASSTWKLICSLTIRSSAGWLLALRTLFTALDSWLPALSNFFTWERNSPQPSWCLPSIPTVHSFIAITFTHRQSSLCPSTAVQSNSATTAQICMNERKPTTGTAKPALTKSQPAIICLISNFQSQTDGWIQRKKGHWPLPLPHEECLERMLPFRHKIVETDPYSVDLVIRAQQCLGSHQMYRYYNESHFRHVSFNISNASSRITPNKFQNINTKSLRR